MNAFTQTDTTTYYFECYTSVVPTSLDMLTSMLAHPLLLEDVVEREIHSVDNGLSSNLIRIPYMFLLIRLQFLVMLQSFCSKIIIHYGRSSKSSVVPPRRTTL